MENKILKYCNKYGIFFDLWYNEIEFLIQYIIKGEMNK